MKTIIAASIALVVALGIAPATAAVLPDPNAYPKLDAKQLGHLNAIVALARQPDSDWSSMGAQEPGQGGFDAYRYQLAMMSYTLALAHYHYTPAYRELDQQTDAQLIHKMQLFDVWGFWEQTSRGAKNFDPSLTVLGEGWIDPVKDQNIMYSGHLFQMITTHQMLYGDARYSAPGAIKFVYNPVGRGLGPQEFDYNTASLAKVLADQFEENGWKGIECEPNAIFPECNQHPLLGFALFDRANGTGYFPKLSAAFKQQFDELNYIDPKTSSFMAMYLVKQKKVIQHPMAWADGWAGSFMHAWYKPAVEQVYPVQKANLLIDLPDGTTTTKSASGNGNYSHDHGFFTLLAAELGDDRTRDRMLRYADSYWAPRWAAGALSYPRQDAYKFAGDGPDVWRRVQPLTGNALIGLARMDRKDGLYKLFNQPFDAGHFAQPFVSGIAYPAVAVTRAVYDPAARALTVTVQPGGGSPVAASAAMVINNLDPARRYGVWRGGRKIGETANAGRYAIVAGRLALTVPMRGETSIVVSEE